MKHLARNVLGPVSYTHLDVYKRQSTHGGNLGEGRVQGFGHVLEAVRQLRGSAGRRQLDRAELALVVNGNNPVNAGMILRAG